MDEGGLDQTNEQIKKSHKSKAKKMKNQLISFSDLANGTSYSDNEEMKDQTA